MSKDAITLDDPDFREAAYEYRDALPDGPARRRAAGLNPGNRFETHRLHIDGDHLDSQLHPPPPPPEDNPDAPSASPLPPSHFPLPPSPKTIPLHVYPDLTRTIINRVDRTSDVPFDWTLNPYRGCEHGCIYCYARPYHEYLGFSCGLDFETKLIAKYDAPDLLGRELAAPKWKGEPIVMSATTDVYQPLEHQLQITRACLAVMAACGQPVTTMTKSALVLRDVDLWAQLGALNAARVTITLVTLDDELAKKLEPRAAAPARRLRVLRELVKAGVPVSVNIAPIIPGLTDTELPQLLKAVADAGATRVAWVLLRLPYQLKDLFLDWLKRQVPGRAAHVEALLRQAHGGKLYRAGATRYRGTSPHAAQIAQVFDVFTRKLSLNRDLRPLTRSHFRRPSLTRQLSLF
jgi:DNA repair photolyase